MSILSSPRRRLMVRAQVDSLRALAESSPDSVAGGRVVSLPARVAEELGRRGLTRARVQGLLEARMGADLAATAEIADGVRWIGLPYLAPEVGATPAEVLDAVDATPIEAAAAGIISKDSAARLGPPPPPACPSASSAAIGAGCGLAGLAGACGCGCGGTCGGAATAAQQGSASQGCSALTHQRTGMGELISSQWLEDIVREYIDSLKPGAKLPADGWPASPPFRPGNWKDAETDHPTYVLASGDTLSGLARLYSGAPQRWTDIWALNKGTFSSPDKLPAGATLNMPPEMGAAAVALAKAGASAAPASPGAPGAVPGADSTALGGKAPMSTAAKVGIAAAGVAVVGGLGYGIYRAAS